MGYELFLEDNMQKIADVVKSLIERIKNEPVAMLTVVEALLFMGSRYLGLDPATEATIMGGAAAVLTLLTRSKVTPVRTLPEA